MKSTNDCINFNECNTWRYIYIQKSTELETEYNNIIHRSDKIKPVDVKLKWYVNFPVKCVTKIFYLKSLIMHKSKRTKNNFETKHLWSDEVFMIKAVSDTVPWTYVIEYLNDETFRTFHER